MVNHCLIGIVNSNNTVASIYCNNHGYLSYTGDILFHFYKNEKKVQELISMGDLKELGEEIGIKHDFNNTNRKYCTAYGRDKNETDVEAEFYVNEAEFLHENNCYKYLYKNNKWYFTTMLKPNLMELTEERITQSKDIKYA